jgi:putative thiamine transport system ATP-binding protein
MAMTVLALSGVAIAIGGRHLIRDLSAEIAAGDCLTVMGPSGCGKSSLLAFISGTLDPAFEARGRITLGDRVLDSAAPERRRLGILFQDDLLFPHLSVGGNLAFALPAAVKGREARRERIDTALRDAGLEGYADRDPATLSGGQRARVALLRTLLAEPEALLLDEPFSKLDTALREDFRHLVFAHARTRGLPTILVTHDDADARAAGGTVLRLAPG